MDMASQTDLDTALTWHLQSNHYPPVPLSMLPACRAAIDALNDEDPDCMIDLPDGVSWRGEPQAPAWAVAEQHHLDAFVNQEWADPLDDVDDPEERAEASKNWRDEG
jgi:hypothetical protein